ncbi:MAG: glycoside hydrolase family 127 protein [Tenuifilaceae bacterium]
MKNTSYYTQLVVIIILLTILPSCKQEIKDYPIQPVRFTSVKVNDNFWAPRIQKNHEVTIPIALKQCEITGRIKNFKIAGKLETGAFCSIYPFDDSDIYKIIEGASFSLQTFPDENLSKTVDTLINYIGLAQEPDGYLYTNRTIDSTNMHEWVGKKRWEKDPELSHELYNIGHMYEAAVAHYQATGKRTLLEIAIKSANLVYNDFIGKQLPYYPGHQVIEMGLVKLYGVTKDKKYLELAQYMLDIRRGGEEYNQAHKPVIEQDKIVGHAVRATYMYSGMADVAAIMHKDKYSKPLFRIWDDLIGSKYYVTGGIGSSGSNEGFGEPYELPNMAAYCETCASIGLVFWNYRMFLLTGDSKYYDVLERTLYNALASGVSLSGDHFFYPNVLESRGQHERSEWFGCACCPSNICRFLPSIPGYIYAINKDQLYTNLYVNSIANIEIDGVKTEIEQSTNYPNDGNISIAIRPEKSRVFTINLRIPSWVNGQPVSTDLYTFSKGAQSEIALIINGEKQLVKVENGYLSINRMWQNNDKIELYLPMEIRMIRANSKILSDKGKVALQRGPFVYCVEWPDNNGNVLNLVVDSTSKFSAEYKNDLLNGVTVVKGFAKPTSVKNSNIELGNPIEFTAIPYYSWANRGAGDMSVWLAINPENSNPTLPPTIASTSKVKASEMKKSLFSINDQELPDSSNDHSILYYHWWPKKGTTEWIEYDFKKKETISESSVYWFDDEPWGGCRIPLAWRLFFEKNNTWIPVKNTENYVIEKNKLNTIHFESISTSKVRIEVLLQNEWASGIYEWSVK